MAERDWLNTYGLRALVIACRRIDVGRAPSIVDVTTPLGQLSDPHGSDGRP